MSCPRSSNSRPALSATTGCVAAGWDYLIDRLGRAHAEFAPLEGCSSVILFGPTGRAA